MKMDTILTILLILETILQINAEGYNVVQPRLGKMCYKCTGIECTRPDFVNQTTTCADIMDFCATIFEGRNVVARGCYAEIPDEFKIRCDSTSDCEICSTLLCNDLAHPDIECAQCNSTANSNCLALPTRVTTSRCPFSSAFQPMCYVRYDGNSTVRGCSASLSDEEECLKDNSCLVCAERGCNAIEFPRGRRQCLTCSGKSCSSQNATLMYCNKLDDQCISMVLDGNIVKGCLSSVEETHRSSCAVSNRCQKCDSNNCNIIDPSVATGKAFTSRESLTVMIAVITLNYLICL